MSIVLRGSGSASHVCNNIPGRMTNNRYRQILSCETVLSVCPCRSDSKGDCLWQSSFVRANSTAARLVDHKIPFCAWLSCTGSSGCLHSRVIIGGNSRSKTSPRCRFRGVIEDDTPCSSVSWLLESASFWINLIISTMCITHIYSCDRCHNRSMISNCMGVSAKTDIKTTLMERIRTKVGFTVTKGYHSNVEIVGPVQNSV